MDEDAVVTIAKEVTDLLSVRLRGQEFGMVFVVLHLVLEYLFMVASEQMAPQSEVWYRRKFLKILAKGVPVFDA